MREILEKLKEVLGDEEKILIAEDKALEIVLAVEVRDRKVVMEEIVLQADSVEVVIEIVLVLVEEDQVVLEEMILVEVLDRRVGVEIDPEDEVLEEIVGVRNQQGVDYFFPIISL